MLTVGLLVYVIVPASVVVLMTAVGLNLRLTLVREVLRNPRSLLVSTTLQVVLLPAAALILIAFLEPPAFVALVILAVSISPGGSLSNAFTHLIGGNLALSVLMTMMTTLLVSAFAPLVIAIASGSGILELEVAAKLDPLSVGYDLARFALLPICAGLLSAHFLPGLLPVLRRGMDALSIMAIVTVFACSLVVSWPVMLQATAMTLVYAAAFSLSSLCLGAAVARLLPAEDRSACFIEFGVRNLPIALVLATGSTPSAEIVAFLLCYFIVNTAILIVFSLLRRKGSRGVMA